LRSAHQKSTYFLVFAIFTKNEDLVIPWVGLHNVNVSCAKVLEEEWLASSYNWQLCAKYCYSII